MKRIVASLVAVLVLGVAAYEAAAVMRARGRSAEVVERVRARELKLSDIPERRIKMLLAVEDPGFYEHRGIDFSTPGQGMTTIPQALAKFLYFDDFEPGLAKLELMLVARFALDPLMDKNEQLEVFLNYVRFGGHQGRPVRGFADAARTFYGRELTALTDGEYLSLVAMLVAPQDYHVLRQKEANAERTRRIEALLAGRCRPTGLRDVAYEGCAAAAAKA